jgi:hypothetical protein
MPSNRQLIDLCHFTTAAAIGSTLNDGMDHQPLLHQLEQPCHHPPPLPTALDDGTPATSTASNNTATYWDGPHLTRFWCPQPVTITIKTLQKTASNAAEASKPITIKSTLNATNVISR